VRGPDQKGSTGAEAGIALEVIDVMFRDIFGSHPLQQLGNVSGPLPNHGQNDVSAAAGGGRRYRGRGSRSGIVPLGLSFQIFTGSRCGPETVRLHILANFKPVFDKLCAGFDSIAPQTRGRHEESAVYFVSAMAMTRSTPRRL
jgi:hypothetical protein